jgi:hypothetical protein
MELRKITPTEFESAVERVSQHYGGNLRVARGAHALGKSGTRGRVEVIDSRGPGARRSWSGRRGRYACWHVYRDVLREVFRINPDATVITGLARYKGSDGFEREYPLTADKNVGSWMEPAYMSELCDCDDPE